MINVIATDQAPSAIGPYSQAVTAGSTIFVSGQLPLDPATGNLAGADIISQTKQSLQNLQAILEAAGTDLAHVVKTTVFLADMEHFAQMNSVYGTFFVGPCPARSTVEVSRLPKDALVEIEAIARH